MNRHLLIPVLALLLVFANACSDSPSEPTEPVSGLDCVAPALASATAKPLERVLLTGVTGSVEDAWVEFETESGATGITAIVINDAGKPEIVIPPNPDDLMGGGTITLTVTDNIGSCGPLSIEVLPTAPVEGDPIGEALAAADSLVAEMAASLNVDPAVVAATSLDALPPQAVPLALALEALEAFDPAAVLAGMTSDEAAFAQAMFASVDLAGILSDELASLTVINQPPPGGTVLSITPPEASLMPRAARREGCTALGAVPAQGVLPLSTAEDLSDLMKYARGAGEAAGPLAEAISTYGTAFAVMGLAVPAVGVVAGWAAFFTQLIQEMVANLYPSAITRLEYQIDQNRIEEDWDETKGDPPIKWSFAKIWATNNGMSLARLGINLIFTATSISKGFSGQTATALGALEILGENEVNGRLDEIAQDPENDAECWGIAATEFGPIVVEDSSADRWVDAEVISGDAIAVSASDNRKIETNKIGTATLRVRTQPDPFPGPFGFEDKSVEVLRKEVVWTPRTLLVQNPGETVTVKVRVDNSKHNKAEDIRLTQGPGLPPLNPTFSGGVHTITFQTSDKPEDYPTWIEVCSTSKELPPTDPTRCTRIEIFADERVEIAKKDVCVSSGDTETFTAVAGGPGDVVVKWEIESGAGTLSTDTGLSVDYTAPGSGSGAVTLRAYIESKPSVEDRITFRYGACSGLAVYYANLVEINFPFTSPGSCDNADLDDRFEELTFPEAGLLPEVLPAPGDIWVGRTENFSHELANSGILGDIPVGSDVCRLANFEASGSYDGTLTGSADGSRLDIDVSTRASGLVQDMGELGVQNSNGSASMSLAGRFDFDLTAASDYRLQVNLDCETVVLQGFPLSGMLSIIAIQVRPDGSYAPVNATTQPIQLQCQPGVTLAVDRVLQFDAPAGGQTDHVMVMFQIDNTVLAGLPTDSGPVVKNGFLRGFISVKKQ